MLTVGLFTFFYQQQNGYYPKHFEHKNALFKIKKVKIQKIIILVSSITTTIKSINYKY